jgi:hypothetical protein
MLIFNLFNKFPFYCITTVNQSALLFEKRFSLALTWGRKL